MDRRQKSSIVEDNKLTEQSEMEVTRGLQQKKNKKSVKLNFYSSQPLSQ